ncbi:MAG: CDP-diacylglycerol--glycerol-3-phosphate 3-phosphatidyltransferase, partial [Oscillospiraceae bacterium]
MNTPNKLTIFRMLMTPIFLAAILIDVPHRYLWAIITFSIAAITDALDGKLARKNNQVTVFGKLTDPVADKMLTTAALLAFMELGLCNIWIVLIVLTREFAVTSIRLVASAEGIVIPANMWGKIKTVSQ